MQLCILCINLKKKKIISLMRLFETLRSHKKLKAVTVDNSNKLKRHYCSFLFLWWSKSGTTY